MIRATKTGIVPLIAGALGVIATGWASASYAQDPPPAEAAPPVTGTPPELSSATCLVWLSAMLVGRCSV